MSNNDNSNNNDVIYHDIDDGHSPGGTKATQTLVENLNKYSSDFVSIYDNLLSPYWVNTIYEYAVSKGRPWGIYISGEDALNNELLSKDLLKTDPERAMALEAVRELIYNKGSHHLGTDKNNRVHGTAVWCLASTESASVSYHIDYAELFRYETNSIHPPLYAGTCQLSPFNNSNSNDNSNDRMMQGGDFMVNTSGLDHYRKFGYKGALQSEQVLEDDLKHGDWITIRYKENRGILHDGDFPHLSTPVKKVPVGYKRVILGFNCFSSIVSECCIRAPEHSDAFNRTVKLYQAIAHTENQSNNNQDDDEAEEEKDAGSTVFENITGGAIRSETKTAITTLDTSNTKEKNTTKKKSGSKISAKDIMRNPALAKLLVLAAKKMKEKEKQEEKEKEKEIQTA